MKKVKWFLSIVFLSLCLCPTMVSASYPVDQYPYVPSIEKMQQNGEYSIYVLKGGQWQEAGKLIFDEYFREREIDLSKYMSEGQQTRIRLVQKGGKAAHIDSIFLGKMPPAEVVGNEKELRKLSNQDFDVIDAYGKSIEVVFRTQQKDKTLRLTARIEDINKGVPFQFPLSNMCRKIGTDAHFYTYKLNSQKGKINLDGQLDEVAHRGPFFKEYSRSVTGHPSSYTYGWVRNDDENLYVVIDFTGDNTLDGDKDFAKVYVKTDEGVKEFKVSVPETKWGKPGFSYTNNVGYQHKVYEFKIPLIEVGKRSLQINDKLLIAFSAYGTDGGACCYGDGTTECTVTSQYDCQTNLKGLLAGEESCDEDTCPTGNYIYEALIDSVPGGGGVTIVQGNEASHVVQGIDYKVAITFDGSTGMLGPTNIYKWNGSSFDMTPDGLYHNIGYGNGYDGSSVVEFKALKSALGNPQNMTIIYHASRALAYNDYTGPFQYPPGGIGIPTLSQWGMIILSMLLAVSALLILRKRKTKTAKLLCSLLIILILSGVAWAVFCTDIICLNGNVDDWEALGTTPSIIDTKDDSSANDRFEDIFAGYITSDNNYFYFRMDVDVPNPVPET